MFPNGASLQSLVGLKPPTPTPPSVAPGTGGAASSTPPQPTANFGPVNARQEARVGAQNISVSYLPDLGAGLFLVGLIALVVFILWRFL